MRTSVRFSLSWSRTKARRSDGPTKSLPESQAYVPASELQTVLARVQQEPEVRTEVLRRVSQRLAKGEYLTSEAAEQTAERLLGN